ncbi:beta-lactamase family protein [Mucilaginibacter sp. BJC16-A38]|uniref:serine hydrolase domain-containing protein n=1 Tax=Mucilaginibacter phenanthrenivorans TaxID=1234842 RepID=UPI002157CC41|nr:serine hydrolase domain-containing protein [Mucilaginibacter phenanthrenivorans]MCR8561324.1 beta-lactamase family protein [Mucilaginibacter phenanthrenivorans]
MKHLFALFGFIIISAGHLFGQGSGPGNFIDSFVSKHNFNGTVLIEQKSASTYHKSYGLANMEFKVANTNDMRYKVASITKMFTSTLIMQLVEKGLIDLEKPFNTYLPDCKGEAAGKVTVHQLLNHTSGIANTDTVKSLEVALKFGVPFYQKPRSTDELLSICVNGKLVNQPGKVFDYNNADYIILGKIIERLCHKTYEEVLKEKILLPLKMENSGLLYQKDIIANLADTYMYRDDIKQMVPDLPVYPENWYAAGAMYSTATDLLKFTDALFAGKLVKQESLNRMFVSGLGEYGFGVWVYENYDINGKMYRIVKRPGLIMGAQAMMFHVLGEGTTIIILSNTATTSLDEFAAELAKQVVR